MKVLFVVSRHTERDIRVGLVKVLQIFTFLSAFLQLNLNFESARPILLMWDIAKLTTALASCICKPKGKCHSGTSETRMQYFVVGLKEHLFRKSMAGPEEATSFVGQLHIKPPRQNVPGANLAGCSLPSLQSSRCLNFWRTRREGNGFLGVFRRL
jgi:hypothetical protein